MLVPSFVVIVPIDCVSFTRGLRRKLHSTAAFLRILPARLAAFIRQFRHKTNIGAAPYANHICACLAHILASSDVKQWRAQMVMPATSRLKLNLEREVRVVSRNSSVRLDNRAVDAQTLSVNVRPRRQTDASTLMRPFQLVAPSEKTRKRSWKDQEPPSYTEHQQSHK